MDDEFDSEKNTKERKERRAQSESKAKDLQTIKPRQKYLVMYGAVRLEQVRNLGHEGIVGVRVGEQRGDGQKHLRNGERGAPVVLENIEADAAARVDLREREGVNGQ